MNQNDLAEFGRLITGMGLAFRQEITTPLLTAYRMGLDDKPLDRIRHAIARAIRECKWMPTVAELREMATVHRLHEHAPQDPATRAKPGFKAEVKKHLAEKARKE